MRIVILMGSPNRDGSTWMLVDSFVRGSEAAGHACEVIDVCHADVHPCVGCVRCGYEGPCVQRDDVEEIRGRLLASDMVVFATPLYYYGMTAQLKAVVDRFCAYNASLNAKHLRSALLAVAWNADDWTFESLVVHYKTLTRYLNLEDQGMVCGYGCGMPAMTRRSRAIRSRPIGSQGSWRRAALTRAASRSSRCDKYVMRTGATAPRVSMDGWGRFL